MLMDLANSAVAEKAELLVIWYWPYHEMAPCKANYTCGDLCRVPRLRAGDEEASLLCQRLASNAAASSRSAWGAAAAPACVRSYACGAQPSRHARTTGSASCMQTVKGMLAHTPFGSAAGQSNALWRAHAQHAQRPWTSAALHAGGSRRVMAGLVVGTRPAVLTHSLSHRAWLHWQLQRLGQHGTPTAACRGWAWGGVRAWNSYSMTSYTPKLPHWFRSRLPDMPEGEWKPSMMHIHTIRTCTSWWFYRCSSLHVLHIAHLAPISMICYACVACCACSDRLLGA